MAVLRSQNIGVRCSWRRLDNFPLLMISLHLPNAMGGDCARSKSALLENIPIQAGRFFFYEKVIDFANIGNLLYVGNILASFAEVYEENMELMALLVRLAFDQFRQQHAALYELCCYHHTGNNSFRLLLNRSLQ